MSKKNTCEIPYHDQEKVQRIQGEVHKADLASVAQLFKAIADENRAKIVYALCQDDELCVCDLANIIGSSVGTTSHHLRTLNKHGVVKFRKEGKLAFYSLDDEHIRELILVTLVHVQEVKVHV